MSQSHEPPLTERPTHVRYGVLSFLCVLAFILYLDRICISKAVPKIEEDLGISHTNMSYVLAAFTVAYSLFEVPTGWWGDKYGSRGVMTRIVIWWSVFTALTGAAQGLLYLLMVRFLFGAGEAGAYPNAARMLSKWFPTESRGGAQGLYNASALIGGAIAPLVTAYLMEWIGWRWTFVAFSVPGVLWAIVFWWWYREDPSTHPAVNAAERQLIAAGTSPQTTAAHPPIPWRAVLSHPHIWLLGGVLACAAFNTYLYFSWYPTYLEKGRGVDSIEAGRLASLVLAGGALGCIGGGVMIDWLVRRTHNRHVCRRVWGAAVFALAAACLLAGRYSDSPRLAALWTSGSVLCSTSALSCWWGAVTDISGRHLGALFGLMNSMGGLGAIASQLFVGRFADWMKARGHTGRAQWDPMFYVYAGVLFLGALTWLFIDSRNSVDAGDSANNVNGTSQAPDAGTDDTL